MKLFSRTLLSWDEPVLFAARTRDRRGWTLRGLLALGIFAAMLAAFVAQKNWGRGPKFGPAGAVALSAVIGLFLTALLDAPSMNKSVVIDEDSISTFGNAGTVHSHGRWKFRNVVRVRVIRPSEFGRAFGAVAVVTRRGTAWLGLPAKIPAERVANVLAGRGVSVELAGWEPGAGEERPTTPTFVATPTAAARVEPLDGHFVGSIRTPARRQVTFLMELVPLLVPLASLLGLVGYPAYRLLAARGPVTRVDLEVAGAVLAGLVGGLWVAGRYGSQAPALFLRRAARTEVALRPGAVLDPNDPDAVFVSVVPRANWGKLMMNQATDVGFLKVDRPSRSLLFEGDTERWRVPASSLISVAVESYVPVGKPDGPPRDGDPHQERYYLTVIKARVGDGEWEAPVSKAPVEWKPRNNALREANAVAVRDQILELLQPSAWDLRQVAAPGAGG